MERWQGKVAIVTGSTSGIGSAISSQLVDAGLQVVGLGRRKQLGEDLAKELTGRKGKFHPLAVDITNDKEVSAAFDWIKEHLGPIHILVNSAGLIRPTSIIDGNTQMWKDTFDANVIGLCIMSREAIKNMRENSVDGHIVHINSIGGHTVSPFPNLNVYPASKFAVTALAETLRHELKAIGSKIKITNLSPSFVKTKMLGEGGVLLHNVLKTLPSLSTEDVAAAVLYVLSTPAHVQIDDLKIRSLW